MTNLLNHVTAIGFNALQALLGIGFVIALVKVVFGQRDGCFHLAGIVFVAVILFLWRAGELTNVFTDLITQLTSPGSSPSLF